MRELIVFALVVGGGLAWWCISNRRRPVRFRPRQVLTGANKEFLFLLQRALPECIVCPRLAATALLEPLGTGKTRRNALARIVGRRVGFAVFDEEMRLIAIIELDHRSRLTRREAECDGYFIEAGIRTLRFDPRCMPSESRVRAEIFSRRRANRSPEAMPDVRDQPLEFKPLGSWRNTLNAHS